MVKKLRFSRIELVDRAGALMLVTFLDDEGNMYQWAPKWAQVEEVFLKQINVERYNKPESAWLNKFAKTAQSVVEGAQKIQSARKVFGKFTRYDEEKLIIERREQVGTIEMPVEHQLTPGFEVSLDFLDNWLGHSVEAFLVNDIAIRLRVSYSSGEVVKEYPEPQEETPEDIPF